MSSRINCAMNFKKTIKIEDRAPITTWLGDSQVWMATALERDGRSGQEQKDFEIDHHELNVAHVCVGFAFELALKALAKSEGHVATKRHEATKNFRSLGVQSQAKIEHIVKEITSYSIDSFLEYLDERMCHPDRKYWMVGKRGQAGAVGFLTGDKNLMITKLAAVHREIVDMVGENTFEDWQVGTHVQTGVGEHLATGYVNQDGSIGFEITEAGKAAGVTTSPPTQSLNIVCPRCGGSRWRKEKEIPEPDDRVTCMDCQVEMRAGDVVSWNKKRIGQAKSG